MNALTTNISSIMGSLPSDLSGLTEEQLKQIILSVKVDEYKAQLNSHIKKVEFNLEEKVNIWLKDKSYQTQRAYRRYLEEFVVYLDEKSILDVDNYTVDMYINTTVNNFSKGKANLVIASLSSFYTLLVRWNFLDRNPFHGAKIKTKVKNVSTKNVITEDEIDLILKKYNSTSISDRKMSLAIHIMRLYGVRVGFFDAKYIEYDGEYICSVSKGKPYKIYVKNDVFVENNKELLYLLNSSTIQTSFKRTITKLQKVGDCSPHDLRHYYACKLYTETKDIYKVSKALRHTSTVVTENYLKGLEVM